MLSTRGWCYRLWHGGIQLVACEGYAPVQPGGTGGAYQIWVGPNGSPSGGVRIIRGIFDNETKTTAILDNTGTNPSRFEGTEIRIPDASVAISEGNGHVMDAQTRVVYTKTRPTLKTSNFLAAQANAFGGLELLNGDYAGPLIQVRRVNDNAVLDIYPTSSGALDTAAIAAFCGSNVGTMSIGYDQSGNGRHAVTAVASREYRIWTGTAITTIGTSGKPFLYVDAEDRGYTFPIPILSGASLSAVMVASIGSGVGSSIAGGRFMSVLGSASTDTDSAATNTRGILIGRAGGPTPSPTWQVYRNAAAIVTAGTSYDTPESVSTIFDGTNVSLRRNNGTPQQAAQTANWNISRVCLGFAGNGIFRSTPGSYIAQWWFFPTALSAGDRDELYAAHQASYGLP
jgi:hypothetical protein